MSYMKRIFALLLLTCLLLGCFSACNTADPDPKDTVGSETESDTETETTPEEKLEKVYLPQEEIPGTRIELTVLYEETGLEMPTLQTGDYHVFKSQEDLNRVVSRSELSEKIAQLDFTEYCVVAVKIQTATGEQPLNIQELILQEDRLVVIYQSHFNGAVDADIRYHTSFVAVKKSDLPSEKIACDIFAYSIYQEKLDQNETPIRLGSCWYPNYYEYR